MLGQEKLAPRFFCVAFIDIIPTPYPNYFDIQSKLSDDYRHNVIPMDQLLSLSVSHLVEQGQLIANRHHDNEQPTTYQVRNQLCNYVYHIEGIF